MSQYRRDISLQAQNAGCDRAGAPVVRGVEFDLRPGEAMELTGPNGSGKTSLLSLFAGHIRPAEGRVSWRSADAPAQAAPFEDSIVFLTHESSVKLALTAEENLLFWAKLYGVGGRQAERAAAAALERFELASLRDVRAGRLSAGQRRRIDLARALMSEREVWLFDEPAASVDKAGLAIMRGMIADHRARGGVAVIATHDDLHLACAKLELG